MRNRKGHRSDDALAVVITAGASPNAYDLVRSLGLAGIPSCVMSSQKNDIAFYSRYCRERIILPPFERVCYKEILAILREYALRSSRTLVLFYASDPELHFVIEHKTTLKERYRFLLPPDEVLEALLNKVLFSKFADERGIPVPFSVVCRSVGEVRAILDRIPIPCIVKPAFTDDWIWDTDEQMAFFGPYKKALRRIESHQELIDFCQALPQRTWGILIQEYVDGRDEAIYSFHGYYDQESRCLASFLGRKIRTYPMHTGGSSYVRTVYDPILLRQSVLMLGRIKYRGIVKIDFKLNPMTKKFEVLEINTRYNLWQLLGAYAGANLAAIAFRDQSGKPPVVSGRYGDDVRLLNFKQDLRSLLTGYLRSREWDLLSYVRSLRGKKYYRVWDSSDPLPFVVSGIEFVKRNLIRLLRVSWFPRGRKVHEIGLGLAPRPK